MCRWAGYKGRAMCRSCGDHLGTRDLGGGGAGGGEWWARWERLLELFCAVDDPLLLCEGSSWITGLHGVCV